MPAPIVFHPCSFNFDDQDIRRVGSVFSGGTSLSGIDDPIETDGGGYWRADFTNGEALDRETGLAWRVLSDIGTDPVVVRFCERLFQPVGDVISTPHDDDTPFDDGEEYTSPGATATALAAALRATSLTIAITSEKPLLGGEVFSIEHPNWGHRAYRVKSIHGDVITFRPPLREAIVDGTPLDFDSPRCQMHVAPGFEPSNPTNIGAYTSCSISLVEDMRKPAG